jgi:hypothetical protein
VLPTECRDQGLGERPATNLADPQTLGNCGGDKRRLRDGGERDEDRFVSEF